MLSGERSRIEEQRMRGYSDYNREGPPSNGSRGSEYNSPGSRGSSGGREVQVPPSSNHYGYGAYSPHHYGRGPPPPRNHQIVAPPAFHPPPPHDAFAPPPPPSNYYYQGGGFGPPQEYWPPAPGGREGPPPSEYHHHHAHGPPPPGYGPPPHVYSHGPPHDMEQHFAPPHHPVTPPHLLMPHMHSPHEYHDQGPPPYHGPSSRSLTPRARIEGPVQIQFRREDNSGPSVYKNKQKKKGDGLAMLAKVSSAMEDDPAKKKPEEQTSASASTPTRNAREPPVAVTPHTAFHPPAPHYHHHHHHPHHPHVYHRPSSPAVISERNSFEEHSPYSYGRSEPQKTVLRKKFSWKHYPELEKFLIANRADYLRHSAMNYTAEQKQYNNWLTEKLLEVAARYNYVFDPEEFNFVAVRDRIRCYYKSYVQTARKRGIFVASVKSKLNSKKESKAAETDDDGSTTTKDDQTVTSKEDMEVEQQGKTAVPAE